MDFLVCPRFFFIVTPSEWLPQGVCTKFALKQSPEREMEDKDLDLPCVDYCVVVDISHDS